MNIKDLTMSFGTQDIFDDINLQIKDKEKVGIIGVNGAGKSTFFKLIMGKLEPDKGKIILKPGTRIGFLPQVISDEIPNMDISVFDFLLDGRPIKKLEKELSEAYTDASIETDEKKLKFIMKRIGKLQEKLEYYEVYNAENILLKIVTGMNIDSDLLDMRLGDLSGGQKSKVAFARLLYSNPEILLLDEPTNHLDMDSKDYIIQYLKHYNGMVLVISHDIEFLDQVTTQTLYVDKTTHKMELFPGNYEKYIKIRNERLKTQERILDKQLKEEEKLKKIIKINYPTYYEFFIKTLNGSNLYYGNLQIMRSNLFDEYCTFVFGVFDNLESELIGKGYYLDLSQEKVIYRVFGYIGELLTNTYIIKKKSEKIKIKECTLLFNASVKGNENISLDKISLK